MTPVDPWHAITRSIAAVCLVQEGAVLRVDPRDLAPSPERNLVRALAERQQNGLPTDIAGLLANPPAGLPEGFILELGDERALASSLPNYLRAAQQFSAQDALQAECKRPEGPRPEVVRGIADRLAGTGADSPATSTPHVRRLDLVQMLTTAPPQVDWLVEQMLARGALTLLAGREGRGKSLLAMAFAVGLSTGENVAGLDTRPGKVLYLDAENGEWEIHRRVRALGLEAGAESRFSIHETLGLDLNVHLSELRKLLEDERPDLLVLDSLRSLAPSVKENDSDSVGPFIDRLRNLIRQYECATLLLHHSSRGTGEYRGSTAIGAGVEVVYMLEDSPNDDDQARRRLTCKKMRLGPQPDPTWLRLSVERGQVYVDQTAEHVDPDKPATVTRNAGDSPIGPDLLRACASLDTGAGVSMADLARSIGRGPKDGTIRRRLGELVKSGELTRGDDLRYRMGDTVPPAQTPYVSGTSGTTPTNPAFAGKTWVPTIVPPVPDLAPSTGPDNDNDGWSTIDEGSAS